MPQDCTSGLLKRINEMIIKGHYLVLELLGFLVLILLFSGLKRRLGITAWREFSEDMTQGLKNLQESATYKRTAENLQFAKDIAKEKTSGMMTGIAASGYFKSMGAKMGEVYVAAKTKMTTSRFQQTFDEALNEHNGTTPAASEPAEKSPQ